AARETALDVLKTEASSLSRLRHPCILEVVEPLEETRGELIFATEPLLSSLYLAIPGSPYSSSLVDLDEVEIQKGILQLCKGLQFLHTSARRIHTNLNPESILINNAGDWKIGGLGLTISLAGTDGPPRWEFPTYDSRMTPYTQRSFDYMGKSVTLSTIHASDFACSTAPEYALDEVLSTASDMYSLGCLMYAVHLKGEPPFKNFGNLGSMREHAGKQVVGMERLDKDLQSLLRSLITRQPGGRPTPETLPSHAFFSSLPISTLNFLDRSNFAAKSREEKISFMKGLTGVLDRFSESLQIRKILPSLLEEMKDPHLLPSILPNVFLVSKIISPQQFATLVLPSLKPLFTIKDPPQNMITLLDNLGTLQGKTEKTVFREHVLPLVYNALESEHAIVQERALKVVPDLCESIDYAEVQGVLFPRVALVFTRTRILSVKVATLVTFLSMVKTLDQSSLTQKLVPLLSKIRTKEPAVMMATLSVQEAMGMKVDRDAVATLVLPQLWAMCIGPLINVDQFQRFMSVIRKLGDRVEKEHNQYLRDSQRIEDRSAINVNGTSGASSSTGPVDFESLVGGTNAATVKADTNFDGTTGWDDDVWGSILASAPDTPRTQSPQTANPMHAPHTHNNSLPSSSSPRLHTVPTARTPSKSARSLGAKPIPPPSNYSSSFQPTSPLASSSFTSPPMNGGMAPMQPNHTGPSFSRPPSLSMGQQPLAPAKPNYNLNLSQLSSNPPPFPSFGAPPSMSPPVMQQPSFPALAPAMTPSVPMSLSSPPTIASRPGMGDLLAPSRPQQPSWAGTGTNKQLSQTDWGDFDPLA
ncbi:hypothetical protein OF83DRAFT_1058941, partial [Amylostereum chailletii]